MHDHHSDNSNCTLQAHTPSPKKKAALTTITLPPEKLINAFSYTHFEQLLGITKLAFRGEL